MCIAKLVLGNNWLSEMYSYLKIEQKLPLNFRIHLNQPYKSLTTCVADTRKGEKKKNKRLA